MRSWWLTLNARERFLLIAGSVIVLLLLGYVLLWQPLQRQVADLQQQVEFQRDQLQWMQQAAAEIKRLQMRGNSRALASQRATNLSLSTLIDQSAQQAGLAQALKRVEPQQNGNLNVRLEAVEFDGLLRWLHGLYQQHGVVIVNAVLNRQTVSGQVNVRLILQQVAV